MSFGGLIVLAILPLGWLQQAILGAGLLAAALWLGRSSGSYLATLMLVLLSVFATFRYGWWRLLTVIGFLRDPGGSHLPLDAFFVLILLAAESYAFLILLLGYLQTIWPLRRAPVPLPDDPDEWPAVDLLIPTYNEPLSVVRSTVFAALNIDWPPDKLNIYLLDDGNREEFRNFAYEAGVGYMLRSGTAGAKAGNINHALERLNAPFVAIFDSDHVPTRSFLQVTMGWFRRDPRLAMLQTPHHFYSPDPFERNLSQFRRIPGENELFYGVVQDGNDFWNATFFCGSCAVIRRTALDEIGGIATETVTEDAHTSLRMQRNGWNTAYINIPQAAGLATERLSGHVRQRIRWARGMVQVLRLENPLFASGLTLPQRLCYFNAMLHFLYALPRMIFLTAPLIYLLLGHTNLPGSWAAILAYALPHLALSNAANSRIQGQHRHSFWNEIYETVMAPYILLPTLTAFFYPRLGRFDVTAKGGVVERTFFDARIAQPFLVLLALNGAGLLAAVPRLVRVPHLEFLWDGAHAGAVTMNALWAVFNIAVLGVATAVARESRQRRRHVRLDVEAPARLRLPNDTILPGRTLDLSSGGVALHLAEAPEVKLGETVRVLFTLQSGEAALPATVIRVEGKTLRLQFDPLTLAEQELLSTVLYSRADNWLDWGETREADRPVRSLLHILRLSAQGLWQTAAGLFARRKQEDSPRTVERMIPLVLLAAAMALPGFLTAPLHAQQESFWIKPRQATHVMPRAAAGRSHILTAQSAAARPEPNEIGRTTPAERSRYLGEGTIGKEGAGKPRLQAAAPVRDQAAPASAAPAQNAFHDTLALKDLGAFSAIELRGGHGYRSLAFALPRTHAVKQAALRVSYSVSPSAMPALSQIKVLLNGTLLGTLPVPEDAAARAATLQQTLSVPAALLARSNQLAFEWVGHYARQCEDAASPALWSRIEPATALDLDGSLLPLDDDLRLLPAPFVDPALAALPALPVYFPSRPSLKALQAAGILTSWFGSAAEWRPLRFPVSLGSWPAGNVLVVAERASELPAALNVGRPAAPTIAVRTNPVDPNGKLLIVTGADAAQLILAAQTVALKASLLEGATVAVRDLTLPAPQGSDEAPRWARTGELIPLGETAAGPLESDGSTPVNVYLHLPPDLYYGERQNVLLSLSYRYNSIPAARDSSLEVRVNGTFVAAVPLPPAVDSARMLQAKIAVPASALRPFSNTFSFTFAFQPAKKGNCEDAVPPGMSGSILRDSYLDLRGLPHWAALPNLELLANAGFPFTRFADLSQATVVMPPAPSARETETYLTLLGHFGAQTGSAALRVAVAGADALTDGAERDFLVLGTAADQPSPARLTSRLRVLPSPGGLRVQEVAGFLAPLRHAWWKVHAEDLADAGDLATSSLPDVVVEETESPYAARRSVVVLTAKDDAAFDGFLRAFLRSSQSGEVAGSVSVLRGGGFQSFHVAAQTYHTGAPWWARAGLWLTRAPWAVALLVVVFAFVLASWLRFWLRRQARRRLQIRES